MKPQGIILSCILCLSNLYVAYITDKLKRFKLGAGFVTLVNLIVFPLSNAKSPYTDIVLPPRYKNLNILNVLTGNRSFVDGKIR